MRCSKDGCDWEGELGDLERHLSNKCLYAEEVCPHGCGQSYLRYLVQKHLHACPKQQPSLQLETVQRQLTQKYELLQQQLLKRLEQQEKKHEEEIKKLQQKLVEQEQKAYQQLLQQEMKYEEDKKELKQQIRGNGLNSIKTKVIIPYYFIL